MKEIWKDVVGYEGLYQVSYIAKINKYNLSFIARACRNHKSAYGFNWRYVE